MKRLTLCYLLLGFILAFSPSAICAKEKPMGEEWFVRSYWLLGTNVRAGWGAWASGNETTFGRILAFDEENAYGYGRVQIASAATGHQADDYHLYGVKKVLMQTGLPKARKKKGQTPVSTPAQPTKPKPFWADTQSLIVRAMVLTQDRLIVAGPPDLRRKKDGILAYANEAESLAFVRGERGSCGGCSTPPTVELCPRSGWTPCRFLTA